MSCPSRQRVSTEVCSISTWDITWCNDVSITLDNKLTIYIMFLLLPFCNRLCKVVHYNDFTMVKRIWLGLYTSRNTPYATVTLDFVLLTSIHLYACMPYAADGKSILHSHANKFLLIHFKRSSLVNSNLWICVTWRSIRQKAENKGLHNPTMYNTALK